MDHRKYKIMYRGKTIGIAFGETNAIFLCEQANIERNDILTMGFFRTEEDEGGRLYSRRERRAMIEELEEELAEKENRKDELQFEIERIEEEIASLKSQIADLQE